MKAIGVSEYGHISNLVAKDVDEPKSPEGREMLVEYVSKYQQRARACVADTGRVQAMSVNPIDIKVRKGEYDDAPDFYENVPKPFHIIGPDGAGVVLKCGPDVRYFKPGDEIFYGVLPTFQGNAAERVIVNETLAGHKPKKFDLVEAAALTVTYGTAYEALFQHLGTRKGERSGILIINGAGGVGSMAYQLARNVLQLPVVITTASRPETVAWTKKMGATHVLDHRRDLKRQVDSLNLDIPIRYIFILHSTAQYLPVCAEICEPFGKICSIVQSSELNFYGTKFLTKSLTFAWCWLGSRAHHRYDQESQHSMMEGCSRLIDDGKILSHVTRRIKLTCAGLQEAHRAIESNTTIGKVSLGVNENGSGKAFT